MLKIHLLLVQIRVLNPHWKNYFSSFFSLIFMLKLNEPFRIQEILNHNSSDLGLESRKVSFFWQILVDMLPLRYTLSNRIVYLTAPSPHILHRIFCSPVPALISFLILLLSSFSPPSSSCPRLVSSSLL